MHASSSSSSSDAAAAGAAAGAAAAGAAAAGACSVQTGASTLSSALAAFGNEKHTTLPGASTVSSFFASLWPSTKVPFVDVSRMTTRPSSSQIRHCERERSCEPSATFRTRRKPADGAVLFTRPTAISSSGSSTIALCFELRGTSVGADMAQRLPTRVR